LVALITQIKHGGRVVEVFHRMLGRKEREAWREKLGSGVEFVETTLRELARNAEAEAVDGKRCKDCGEWKPLTDFHKARGKNTWQSVCVKCHAVRSIAWAESNPEKTKAIQQRRDAKRKEQRRLKREQQEGEAPWVDTVNGSEVPAPSVPCCEGDGLAL
jgi:hypothetical protein